MSLQDRCRYEGLDEAKINSLVSSASHCIELSNSNLPKGKDSAGALKFSRLIGVGVASEFVGTDVESFEKLKQWLSHTNDYVMGYFSYDAKNMIENLSSQDEDKIGFEPFYFFVPETLIIENEGNISVLTHAQNLNSQITEDAKQSGAESELETISKEKYLETVKSLQNHIQLGDIYEVNYCVQHKFENALISPHRLYTELQVKSPAPFSCFVSHEGRNLMSSSPERFMKNESGHLVSQPMKGTNRRMENNELQKERLAADTKERAENIMITDLVRNDLSKSAKKGTVSVDELCGVYEFKHVNQMISTVSATLRDELHPLDALLNAFPMGSMTGAPKIRAMELIDQAEDFSRGLYSGSVGYFTPDLDFDFNVIIRSILYNADKKVVTFPTGSAITINSDPEKEYEECMLKAEAMRNVIQNHA
ncbi:MAG: para-aminobenzoate synthetase component 1 [Bacteroidia bacterium]|jgi:para-aminobenzoate synthetase component 1